MLAPRRAAIARCVVLCAAVLLLAPLGALGLQQDAHKRVLAEGYAGACHVLTGSAHSMHGQCSRLTETLTVCFGSVMSQALQSGGSAAMSQSGL